MDDGVVVGSAPVCAPAGRVRWSEAVEEAVIAGTGAGMVLREVCAQAGMPGVRSVVKRAAADAGFAARLRAAREAAGLGLRGRPKRAYCAETGEAICARLCMGEAMVQVLRDVEMPGYSTLYRWLREDAGFAEAVALARDIQGLRLAELGWEDACAVTPETAFATRVKLEHLRWYAGKLAPRKYGALKACAAEGGGDDEGRGGDHMTVIVKRFSEITPEDEAEADETERLEKLGRWG